MAVSPDVVSFSVLLGACVRAAEWPTALQAFDELRDNIDGVSVRFPSIFMTLRLDFDGFSVLFLGNSRIFH